MEPTAAKLLPWLKSQQQAMVDFLSDLARAESPSDVPETQQPVLTLMTDALADLELRVRRFRGRQTGGQLYAAPPRQRRRPFRQLLIGHCDTVWPSGTLAGMPVEERDGALTGPGVFDMKAGLTQIVFALRALREFRLSPDVTPLVFINTDEEIGSEESSPKILRLARLACRAFVLEPSLGLAGQLKTARKGVGQFTIHIEGKAAHAGLNPESGASAILELSHVVQELFALNDPGRGTTVNVGVIDGGLRPNVVAPHSRAVVDVRVATQEESQRIDAAIHGLQPQTPNVTLQITGGINRPPLERTPGNQQLWRLAQGLGQQLGMELEEGTAGGGSDGNLTSLYVPTLDGLGAVGDGAHASHEFVYVEKLPQRTALLALLLLAPHTPNPPAH